MNLKDIVNLPYSGTQVLRAKLLFLTDFGRLPRKVVYTPRQFAGCFVCGTYLPPANIRRSLSSLLSMSGPLDVYWVGGFVFFFSFSFLFFFFLVLGVTAHSFWGKKNMYMGPGDRLALSTYPHLPCSPSPLGRMAD